MTAELVVMTSERDGDKFRVYRTPIDDVDSIPRTGVLFVIISCEDLVKPRLNGRRRLCEAHGRDWYTLVVRGENVMLAGWDDGDFVWKKIVDPWVEASTTRPDHLPLVHPAITFKGEFVEKGEWEKALKQFNDEMH